MAAQDAPKVSRRCPPMGSKLLADVPSTRVDTAPLRLGFWAECYSRMATPDADWELVGIFDARSAVEALGRVRGAVRELESELQGGERVRALMWLEARRSSLLLHSLACGVPLNFALGCGHMWVQWRVRQVLHLPLADRESAELPPCADRFACPKRFCRQAPGHRCGGESC
jgi:hypothetical protein